MATFKGKPERKTYNRGIPAGWLILLALIALIAVFKKSNTVHTKKATGVTTTSVFANSFRTAYALEGVFCNEGVCLALINGRMLQLQSVIDNFMVTKITAKSAELINLRNKNTLNLELK